MSSQSRLARRYFRRNEGVEEAWIPAKGIPHLSRYTDDHRDEVSITSIQLSGGFYDVFTMNTKLPSSFPAFAIPDFPFDPYDDYHAVAENFLYDKYGTDWGDVPVDEIADSLVVSAKDYTIDTDTGEVIYKDDLDYGLDHDGKFYIAYDRSTSIRPLRGAKFDLDGWVNSIATELDEKTVPVMSVDGASLGIYTYFPDDAVEKYARAKLHDIDRDMERYAYETIVDYLKELGYDCDEDPDSKYTTCTLTTEPYRTVDADDNPVLAYDEIDITLKRPS